MIGKIFIAIFVGFLLRLIILSGILKQNDVFQSKYSQCQYIDVDAPGPEDIVAYNSTVLITGSGDLFKPFELGEPQLAKPGQIFAIYDADSDPKLIPLKIYGFPKELAFHPHGIYLYTKHSVRYLYVINHAYNNGGERVEVKNTIYMDDKIFQFVERDHTLILQFIQSLVFDPQFNGVLNDLIVVGHGELIITKYLKYQDPLTGRNDISRIKNVLNWIFNVEGSYAYFCEFETDQKVYIQCKPIDSTRTIMNNGISIDKNDYVYIAETIQGKIRQFKLNTKQESILDYIQTIPSNGHPDNIEYDSIKNKLYIGGIYKLFDHLKVIHGGKSLNGDLKNSQVQVWGLAEEIDLNRESQNYMKNIVVYKNTDGLKGTSSSYQMGNFLYFGSWADYSIVKCPLIKEIKNKII